MPDPSAVDWIATFAHMDNPFGRGNGGIVRPSPNYRGYNVEIRPKKWEKKIWIGKLKTLELAQYAANAVRHYLGMPPFFSKEGVMTLPVITCIGTVVGTPVELSTPEMSANYVSAIAKGKVFQPQRDDFKQKVKNVVKNPDFPFLTPPRTEVAVLDDDDSDRDDEFVDDEDTAKALQMSLHSGSSGVPVAVLQTHVAGPDSGGGSEASYHQAYVPSFDVDSNGSQNILRSAGQSMHAVVFSIYDCPTTSSEDEKFWIESIEVLDKRNAVGASTPSVASNDGEVCRDGYETSPILDIPRIVRPCTSSSKFFGTPVESAVPVGTALGSSSDWPANAKKQKIGV